MNITLKINMGKYEDAEVELENLEELEEFKKKYKEIHGYWDRNPELCQNPDCSNSVHQKFKEQRLQDKEIEQAADLQDEKVL